MSATTLSTPAERARRRWQTRKHNDAAAVLVAALIVIIVGLVLVYKGKTRFFDDVNAGLNNKRLLNLNEVSTANELLPFLTVFENGSDREFVATKIYEYINGSDAVSAHRRFLPNVGALTTIQVDEKEIDSNPHLELLRRRLAEVRGKQTPTGLTGNTRIQLVRSVDLRQMKPNLVVRRPSEFRSLFLTRVFLFVISFFIVYMIWWRWNFQGDRLILPVVLVLSGVGFIMMTAIPDPFRDNTLFADFSIGVMIGITGMLATSLSDASAVLRKYWVAPLLLGLVLSGLLVAFGRGPGSSDAKVNLAIPVIGFFQPVEVIKILVILFLAGYFAQHWQFLRNLSEKGFLFRFFRRIHAPKVEYFLPVVVSMALILLFFLLQKDNGPALILAGVFLLLYAVSRKSFVFALAAPLLMALTIGLAYQSGYFKTVGDRVQMWLSPWDNCVSGGDQLASSLWALSSGGFSGTGLGLGEPSTLPAVHTDLVLSGFGEEAGFIGILCVLSLYAILIQRCLRAALRAGGDYQFFLSLGLTFTLALSCLLIAGGSVGLLPLSGVAFPFLSYGKTSMVANFIVVGLILSISARKREKAQYESFGRPVYWAVGIMGLFVIALLLKASYVQILKTDDVLLSGTLAVQSDGSRRYEYNPRLMRIAREIPRGTIYDRNGLPLATSRWEELEQHRQEYEQLGVNIDSACSRLDGRHYPFGGLTFHLLGDWRTRQLWGASNTLFEERDSNVWLQGYDDHAVFHEIQDSCTGQNTVVQERDFRALIPLLRHRYEPNNDEVERILNRDRDIHMSVDVRLQRHLAAWLGDYLRRIGKVRAAIVVLDPPTGDLLASVSYPYPEVSQGRFVATQDPTDEGSFFDRAREGLYPPGSTFKMVTALAALRRNASISGETFVCRRLADGRVGNIVQGKTIRDDITDRVPHGIVDMQNGITVSCNAYFAQLGVKIGPDVFCDTANLFEISVSKNNLPIEVRPLLPESAYGQGQVVLTPFQMARVAATIANGGTMAYGRWVTDHSNRRTRGALAIVPSDVATTLGSFLRRVVTDGTGRALSRSEIPIAGKTGTAQVEKEASHAWFAGFAPYGPNPGRQIAFSIFIENGRYGGRAAAPVAAEIVSEARDLGIIQ